ncbi:PAN2-PAN3 deadenylation complex catalytic subunit PAN2 [Eumeta japonica]|uniref:PAN2-PAN3 deadenylation complex catalytic subunit PAN2 n=1 Tax=Eumeta variegata TaxID=151549 RepID=A0A4C1UX62_EUMVA|nr:PAN2-PAN3 deadenylation complex catalytic subunit PAN2 [Eumeta japonica]
MHYEILDAKKKEKALLAQNANSPPKSGSRLGNPPLNTVKMFSEEFQYTELEFLGPVSEFNCSDGDFNRDERWNQINVPSEEGGDCGGVPGAAQNGPTPNARIPRDQSAVSTLFAIGRHQLSRCLKCNKEEERDVMLLACALQYPTPSSNKEPAVEPRPGFIELLRASLASRRSTPAWCERCRRFSPTEQRGRIIRLPPILAINCGGVTAHEKAYWAKCLQKEMPESVKRSGSGKPCRYGMQCVRPGCRFKHPERSSPSGFQSSAMKAAIQDTHCVLPLQIMIKLQADGEVLLNENTDLKSESQEKKKEEQSSENKKRSQSAESSVEYMLSAAVVCVEDSPKNLVAYIRLPPDASEQNWYLFNDLR